MNDKEGYIFTAHASGDRTVGDGDHQATVEIPFMIRDPQVRDNIIEVLRSTFSTIFDTRENLVHVSEAPRCASCGRYGEDVEPRGEDGDGNPDAPDLCEPCCERESKENKAKERP
jgi:hypothetical protein